MLQQLKQSMEETYYCVIPCMTFLKAYQFSRNVELTYASMNEMINVNDDAYKKFSELGFTTDDKHRCFKAFIDRARVCPTAMDKETVELDAMVWLNDQLRSTQQTLYMFNLTEDIHITATYDVARDAVLYVMRPVAFDFAQDIKHFLHVNAVVTVLTALAIVEAVLCLLQSM